MRTKLTLLTLLLAGGAALAQELNLEAELMGPVGTSTSRVGDRVFARVLSPDALKGDTVEGKVTEARPGAKNGGRSVLTFSFDTLQHNGASIPIASEIRGLTNSKGRADVDESGRAVSRSGSGDAANAARSANAVGGLVGGLTRSRGVAVARQTGSTAEVVAHQWGSAGPDIRFEPGSRVRMSARALNGPALATLPPAGAAPQAPAPAAAPLAAAPRTATPPAAGAAGAAPPDAEGQESAAQPEMTTLKATFIPGEKTLFFDDFTDMTADDAPPHFKVRGAAPELMAGGNIRQLTVKAGGSLFPNLTSLPKNFTYEAEIKADVKGRIGSNLVLLSKGKPILHWQFYAALPNQMDLIVSMRAPYQELGRKRLVVNWNEPVKLALWVQNGRMRSFVNGEKHLDFNQIDMPPVDSIEMEHSFLGQPSALGYRTVRFAESTPDFSQVISSSGRYVTHGILFDTDSDRLKPESAPVIQAIARGLETNPNLRLLIEGHTDSVGNAAHNLDLSKRRAEAVKAVLVSQFKVDDSRLSCAGIGAAKPIDSNDTPQGRSQNRRVELVKQ